MSAQTAATRHLWWRALGAGLGFMLGGALGFVLTWLVGWRATLTLANEGTSAVEVGLAGFVIAGLRGLLVSVLPGRPRQAVAWARAHPWMVRGIAAVGGAVVVWACERFISGEAWDTSVVVALLWAGVVLGVSALGRSRAADRPPSPA